MAVVVHLRDVLASEVRREEGVAIESVKDVGILPNSADLECVSAREAICCCGVVIGKDGCGGEGLGVDMQSVGRWECNNFGGLKVWRGAGGLGKVRISFGGVFCGGPQETWRAQAAMPSGPVPAQRGVMGAAARV